MAFNRLAVQRLQVCNFACTVLTSRAVNSIVTTVILFYKSSGFSFSFSSHLFFAIHCIVCWSLIFMLAFFSLSLFRYIFVFVFTLQTGINSNRLLWPGIILHLSYSPLFFQPFSISVPYSLETY